MSDIDDLLDYIKSELQEIWECVEQARDEARVQMHLAKAETQNEWQNLEPRYNEFAQQMRKVREELERDGEEILDATRVLGKDLLNSYDRIKGILAA